jgi:stearoyl-CoA desaturase (delta-9 desaturase)
MAFIDYVLQTPSYGWKNEKEELIIPTKKQLFSEFFSRMNIFKTRKNWISLISWFMIVCMIPFLVLFLTKYFTIPLLGAFLLYSLIIMSTHGTIWFHRYSTHKSYKFKNAFWRFITQNLVVRSFPEEIYVVSHHVHHSKSDLPGDPYNAKAGLWYCLLADVNHQSINKNLDENDYNKAAHFVKHTGIKINSYSAYQKWGSIVSPFYTVAIWILNWVFWYGVFYLLGGH